MRRRNFIATLPLAAAGPVLARDASGQRTGAGASAVGEESPWLDLPAAAVTPVGAAPSRHLRITGQERITSFGPGDDGTTRTLRFAGEVLIVHDAARLILPNNGQNLLTAPGDVLTAVAQGGEAWVVTAYQPASVVSKVDRRAGHGGLPFRYVIGAGAKSEAPDFAVDGAFSRTKVMMKSLFLNDPGDTPEIGLFIADGTAEAASAWKAPYPGAFIYGWPKDNTGNYMSSTSGPGFGDAQWLGRNAQIAFPISEDPKPTARGGAMVFSVCPNGRQAPVDRGWFGQRGGFVLAGRALENALAAGTVHYPWSPPDAQAKYNPVPGLNWYDYGDDATLTLIASDTSDNKVMSIRRGDDLQRGVAFDYVTGTDEFRLGRVLGGVFRARWSWTASGDQVPASDRGADLGEAGRRIGAVHADTLDIRREGKGRAAYFHSAQPEERGDVVTFSTARGAGPGFNFLRAVSITPDGGHEAARIDGDGHAAITGAFTGQGRGTGAYMEWADGNPYKDDRVGWAVVLAGDKIRRAGPDDAPEAVIGVISARPNLVADAAWSHWSDKYLTDDFGRPLTRPVQYVRWREPVIETQPVERTRMVAERASQPKREWAEAVDQSPRLEQVGDRWVRRMVETRRPVERQIVQTVLLHGDDGSPLLDDCGAQAIAEVPVFEEVEIRKVRRHVEQVPVETGCVDHCYPAHALPAGVTVPAHAERFEALEKVLNPDFDPSRDYEPRQARPEWDVVAFAGPERLRKGERIGARWLRIRAVSDAVEEWLVR